MADQADAQVRGEEQVAAQFETEIQAAREFLRALGIDGIENLISRPSG